MGERDFCRGVDFVIPAPFAVSLTTYRAHQQAGTVQLEGCLNYRRLHLIIILCSKGQCGE